MLYDNFTFTNSLLILKVGTNVWHFIDRKYKKNESGENDFIKLILENWSHFA